MKKFIKANIIFSMVFNPLMLILNIVLYAVLHTPLLFLIFTAVYALTALAVGVYAIKKFNIIKTKTELKKLAVITLIFNNPLAGILMLNLKHF